MNVSPVVRAEIAKRFSAGDAARVLGAFEETRLPLLDAPKMWRDLDRVHCAILKIGNGDVARVVAALREAAVDWRDVLVAAGLAHGNWPTVLRESGFPDLWPESRRETTLDRCDECGAAQFPGATCLDCFHGLLAFENEHPAAFGAVHHITVASYYLQHPRGYKTEVLALWRSAIADVLSGRASARDLRSRASAEFDGPTRVKDPLAVLPTGWPKSWPMVIRDVYDPRARLPDMTAYIDRAKTWAATVIGRLESEVPA